MNIQGVIILWSGGMKTQWWQEMRQNIPWLLLDEQLKYKMIAKMRQNGGRSAGSAGGEDYNTYMCCMLMLLYYLKYMYVMSTDCIKAAVIIVHVCLCEVYWRNWQQCWWKCLCVFGKNVKWLQNMTGGDVGPRVGERWQFALMISSVSRVDIFCANSCVWTIMSQQCLNDYVWTIIEQWHLSALQLSASSETSERHSTFPNALQCCKVAFCNVDREAEEGAKSDFWKFSDFAALILWAEPKTLQSTIVGRYVQESAMQEWSKKVDYRKLWRASSPRRPRSPIPSSPPTSLPCVFNNPPATP